MFSTMKTATYVKTLEGFVGAASLYRLDPPIETEEGPLTFVIVSAVADAFVHETFIFPATSVGEIVNWGELDGSYTGGTSHERALNRAGYGVVS